MIFWFILQEVTLDGAKQAVANYAGSYCQEFNELRNNLDDGCEVLQQVLVSDVPGPQVKLNVGQLEASKRKNYEVAYISRKYYSLTHNIRDIQTSFKNSKLNMYIKFVFSKKATKIDKIFTIDLTLTTQCQISDEDPS